MGKHDKPEPAGFPVGQPPGERDGRPEKPGKHAKPAEPTKRDK